MIRFEYRYRHGFQRSGSATNYRLARSRNREARSEQLSYQFEYYGDRNIKFTFDNILLPDSSADFEASQGFVSFRISQKAGVPLETNIENRAGIFFDFNAPVYTNTTVHRG